MIETFPKVIKFDFVPGGDFDWEIFFRLGAALPDPDLFFAADFSHTAAVTFVGPTASSGSGVFPGTIPLSSNVPEPNAFWVVGSAFVLLLRQRVR